MQPPELTANDTVPPEAPGAPSTSGWRAPLLLLVVYAVLALLLQISVGASSWSFNTYPDEPAHLVGSVMVRDWLMSGQWFPPMRFAADYYQHHPYFAIGYWPPLFHGATGVILLAAGGGRAQALLLPGLSAAVSAWLIFLLLRRRAGTVAAVCGGLLFLGLPATQVWMCAVMVDHFTAALCLGSAVLTLRYLEKPGAGRGLWCALCIAAAVLSKYSAVYTAGLPIAAAICCGFRPLLRRTLLMQPAIAAALVAPWCLWTAHLAHYGLPSDLPRRGLGRAAAFFTGTLDLFPLPARILVIAGVLLLIAMRWAWDAGICVPALLYVSHLVFLFISPVGAEDRYLLAPGAALIVLSFSGWSAAAERLAPRLRPGWPALMASLTGLFLVLYSGAAPRPRPYPLRAVAAWVLAHSRPDDRILVFPDLEGPLIAEFVLQRPPGHRAHLLRPSKKLARMDWFGQQYAPLGQTPAEIATILDAEKVALVLWHEDPSRTLRLHESSLRGVLTQPGGRFVEIQRIPESKGRFFQIYRRATTS